MSTKIKLFQSKKAKKMCSVTVRDCMLSDNYATQNIALDDDTKWLRREIIMK